MKPKLTRMEFINRANKLHNNKFDYSLVQYKNVHTKITIICPIHGKFLQKPHGHLNGFGCRKCKDSNMFLTTQKFIEKAKQVHGDRYNYSHVNYIDSHKKVTIICREHGKFYQRPNAHISGKQGCKECSKKLYKATHWNFKKDPNLKNLPASFYIIRVTINNIEYNKVGVTVRSIKNRYAGIKFKPLCIINTTLYNACYLEREILKEFNSYKLSDRLNFSGWTEILLTELNLIKNKAEQVLQSINEKH